MSATAYILEADFDNYKAWVAQGVVAPGIGIYEYNGAVFMAVRRSLTAGSSPTITVYRTTDGQTFTSYDGPAFNNWGVSQDPINLNKLWFVYKPEGVGAGAATLISFNMATLSFGTEIFHGPSLQQGTSATNIVAYNGQIHLFYARTSGTIDLYYSKCNGIVWTEIDTLFETDVFTSSPTGSGVDPATGNMCVWYMKNSGGQKIFVRSLSSGTFSSPAIGAYDSEFFNNFGSPPLYISEVDSWVIPTWTNNGGGGANKVNLQIATPSVSPVTITAELVATAGTGVRYEQTSVRREDTNITVFYQSSTSSSPSTLALKEIGQSRLAAGGAYGAQTVIFDRVTDTYVPVPTGDSRTDGGVGFIPLSSTIAGFEAWIPGTANNQYLVGVPEPPPSPAATPTNPRRGGRPRSILLNDFDVCLAREFRLLDLIDPCALSCNKNPHCIMDSNNLPCMPAEGRPFMIVNSIPLPDPTDGDVDVINGQVPIGYDGILLGHFQIYTGPNFQEGSEDLFWRLKLNLRYAKNWGALTVTMGDPKTLSPVYGGLRLLSGQLFRYQVSAPNTSGALPPAGNGNIICGLHGFWYPRK